jgi:hypothetical protein
MELEKVACMALVGSSYSITSSVRPRHLISEPVELDIPLGTFLVN